LTQEIDIDDYSYIAFSLSFNAPLWTGDKKLIEHLKSKNFELVIDTNSLIELIRKAN
jgi:predicted nucleic acid-binding protein